jgi:hypothetical protein
MFYNSALTEEHRASGEVCKFLSIIIVHILCFTRPNTLDPILGFFLNALGLSSPRSFSHSRDLNFSYDVQPTIAQRVLRLRIHTPSLRQPSQEGIRTNRFTENGSQFTTSSICGISLGFSVLVLSDLLAFSWFELFLQRTTHYRTTCFTFKKITHPAFGSPLKRALEPIGSRSTVHVSFSDSRILGFSFFKDGVIT